jgi:hypothetical protein
MCSRQKAETDKQMKMKYFEYELRSIENQRLSQGGQTTACRSLCPSCNVLILLMTQLAFFSLLSRTQ